MLDALLVFADILVVGCVLYVQHSNGRNIRSMKEHTDQMKETTKDFSDKLNNK